MPVIHHDHIPNEVIAELKAQHGEVHLLEHAGNQVVVTVPNRSQWKRFRAGINDPRRQADAVEMLLRDCVVHPDKEAFDALLEKRPGVAETFGVAVIELAGASKDVEKKELL